MKILITGSSGLIGSQAVKHFCFRGHEVVGIDNNSRKQFFGEEGDTSNVQKDLQWTTRYKFYHTNICDTLSIDKIMKDHEFDLIIHLRRKS